jgi:hypothetical protein
VERAQLTAAVLIQLGPAVEAVSLARLAPRLPAAARQVRFVQGEQAAPAVSAVAL